MAYQNVGTPRFYVNVIEWLTQSGVDVLNNLPQTTWNASVWNTLPVNPTDYYSNYYISLSGYCTLGGFAVGADNQADCESFGESAVWTPTFEDREFDIINIPAGVFNNQSFWAILGHNIAEVGFMPWARFVDIYANENIIETTDVINFPWTSLPEHDGFSIATLSLTDINNLHVGASANIGSMMLGTYYDMKNAPNLSLTMSRDYGGTKEHQFYNGGTGSNTMWSKPSQWGKNRGAWELGSQDHYAPIFSRSGRRSWELKFSFVDDGNLWGSNQMLSVLMGDSLSGDEPDAYDGGVGGDLSANTLFRDNLLTDDNFFSQVWHKTLGGTLPFIFQPDAPRLNTTTQEYEGGNNNPDQFATARFKSNTLKATQSAFNVYDISVSIEEIW